MAIPKYVLDTIGDTSFVELRRVVSPHGTRIATLLVDSGSKYLSTEVYRR